ncbi:MAG: hypothetical protein QOD06_3332 [Candidatus Binatota bacterium]|jgi:hypothetical protein|nr:hypothetical protein [Candidatus Binatota bacterium]
MSYRILLLIAALAAALLSTPVRASEPKQEEQAAAPKNEAVPAEPDKAYVEARVTADRHTADPNGTKYFMEIFRPQFQERHADTLTRCTETVQNPDFSPFSFVAVIDAKGDVQKVYLSRESNMGQCLALGLLADKFPPPPFPDIHLPGDMKLNR